MNNVLVAGKNVEPCVVCGIETPLIDKSFEAPICSTGCSSDLWDEYLDMQMWGSIRKEIHQKHGKNFASAHEAYAVMKEELEEVWEAIRQDNISHAKVEAVQLAAVCLKFLRSVRS